MIYLLKKLYLDAFMFRLKVCKWGVFYVTREILPNFTKMTVECNVKEECVCDMFHHACREIYDCNPVRMLYHN